MEFDSLTEMLGGLMPYALVAFLGLVLSLLASMLLVTGRKLNPGLAVGGVGLAALGSALTAWWVVPGDPSVAGALDGIKLATTTRFVAWLGISAVSLFALLPLAAAGARKGPRDLAAAGVSAAAIAVVVGVTALAGVLNGEHSAGAFFYARAAGYAVLGALVVTAMLSGGEPKHPGRQAGAAASLVFALMVAVCETANRGATIFMLLVGLPTVEPERREAVVQGYLELTGGEVPWLLLTICLAQGVGLLGVISASRDGEKQNLAGLVWLLVVPPLVWFGGRASAETITAAASAAP